MSSIRSRVARESLYRGSMFTGVGHKNKAAAQQYFDEHLSRDDYYTEKQTRAGQWIGSGVERLGLQEGHDVDKDAFLLLCDNKHPTTEGKLTQRQNRDGNRRVFFDFTCSAPKSVSIMAVMIGDERIALAHEQAAKFAFKEFEQFAAVRVRKDGANTNRATSKVVAASFVHNSSRALDPQLHTHFVTFNCTFDEKEKRWKALQEFEMFAARRYATEVYRNELAKQLRSLGYGIEDTNKGFEIKGVSQDLIQRFSKRARERDEIVGRLEKKLGRKLSDNEVSHVIRKSRSKKVKGISTEELRRYQQSQLTNEELSSLLSLRSSAKQERGSAVIVTESEAVKYATEHLFERNSVVPEHELLSTSLIHGRGQVDLNRLKSEIEFFPDLLRLGNGQEISTREILKTEKYLIDFMNAGKQKSEPLNSEYIPSEKLGKDQRQAIDHILKTLDTCTGIRGLAGTGKTTVLSELSKALIPSGCGSSLLFCTKLAL